MPSNRLRVVRAERRITQLRTALAAGIHPTRLWKIENDIVTPTEDERAAIAGVLSVNQYDIWPGLSARPAADVPQRAEGVS
jgi:transcriptional regulator with XRE-family HTH domain